MDEQTFQNKLSEIMERIKELPGEDRTRFEQLADDARQRRERVKSSIAELQESLDYLRLSVKYLVFDLEATRRENAYLRKLVDQAAHENEPDHGQSNDPFPDSGAEPEPS